MIGVILVMMTRLGVFVSFLLLYLYLCVLELIWFIVLTSGVSVDELLLISKVYFGYGEGRERFTEIPAKVEKLVEKLRLKKISP
jgi:hypothetical protein